MNRPRAIVASTVFAGASAWQAPMNGRLADSIGALPASVVSFGTGACFLALAVSLRMGPGAIARIPGLLAGARVRDLSGGLIGATYVLMAILTVRQLGTGGLISTSVAGTLVGAVVVDWLGILGVRRAVPGPIRWAGVVMLIGGTLLVGGGAPTFAPLALLAAFVAGVLAAMQPPINARLALRIGGERSALTQTCVGLGSIATVAGIASLTGQAGGSGGAVPWWSLAGGLLGAAYVFATLLSVPSIGAGGVAAASVAGGLAFGAVADALGMFGLEPIGLDLVRLVGLAVLAAGATLVLRPPAQRPDP